MKAHTIQGLQAKARVLLLHSDRDLNERPMWANHDELMGISIAHDLLGLEPPPLLDDGDDDHAGEA